MISNPETNRYYEVVKTPAHRWDVLLREPTSTIRPWRTMTRKEAERLVQSLRHHGYKVVATELENQ